MKIIPRRAAERLRRMVAAFPAVLVYGPRQCGKSTLARTLYPEWTHVDLERPADAAVLEAARRSRSCLGARSPAAR